MNSFSRPALTSEHADVAGSSRVTALSRRYYSLRRRLIARLVEDRPIEKALLDEEQQVESSPVRRLPLLDKA